MIYIVIATILESIFDGFATIDAKIARAKELGYSALAMTEHGTTTGLMEFYLKCKKEGLKPILGYEGYFSFEPDVKGGNTYHILLLAKNLIGYRNLMKIATYGTKHFYRKPRIGLEILKECHEGIICSTACIAGVLSSEEPISIANQLKEIFSDDFYFEVQPHKFKEQYEYNDKVFKLGKELNIPVIITGDSHYVLPEDTDTHRAWLSLAEDSEYYGSGDYHMMSKLEMQDFFPFNTIEYFDNVSEIIDKCNVEIPLGEENFPVFDTKDPLRFIKDRCNDGWKRLDIQSKPNHKQYKEQAMHEFDILDKCHYTNYMCIIYDMLEHCKKNNIPIGPGRGSVGGSLVAYLMGITEVDPIRFNLVFERFANPERVTSPDIDCDVSSERRGEVIDYIREKYGEVYQIRTISYIQPKSALQRAGKALGYEPSDIDAISTKITTLDEVQDTRLRSLAEKFLGHIEKYSMHASAVVVFPKDVTNWCAVEKSGDFLVAAQDFHLLEKQGIMKLDILGLKNLDIIEWTLSQLPSSENLSIDKLPLQDDYTSRMLRAGYTQGCFQIESNGMTDIIKEINTSRVEDLIDTVALHRPGPLDSGMVQVFEKRRQGVEPVTYLHPKLEPILKDTEGIILYQEQIMQIARELCGYTYGEADNLRRIIGRKIVDEMQPVIDDMLERGLKNGISTEVMQEICDEIITFANYGFNRCLSGSTVIMKDRNGFTPLTIEEMYLAKNDLEWAKKNNKMSVRGKYLREGYGYGLSLGQNGIIKKNRIVDIYYSGVRQTYKLTLASGKSIICTDNHKFPTPNGIVHLSDLIVGDCLYVKGDRNKQSYDYRMTGGYNLPKRGQKGFQKLAFSQTENLDTYRHRKSEIGLCEKCGRKQQEGERFEVHHITHDRTANFNYNIMYVCNSCHKKIHYSDGRARKGDHGYICNTEKIVSIEPYKVEPVYDVEMNAPNHNLIVNDGIVTSNSHSAAYGLLAWHTAYLKAHYTPQYMASVIEMASRDTGSRDKLVFFIEHCKKIRVNVLKPDLMHSQMMCTSNGRNVLLGFNSIAGVGNTVLTNSNDAVKFLQDNVNLNKTVLKNLVRSGACDNYTEKTRWELLEYIDWLKDKRKSKGEFVYSGKQTDTYGEMEFDVLRYTFTDIFSDYDTSIVDGSINVLALVTKIKATKTKKGKPMAFVEVLTPRGAMKCVMFEPKFELLEKKKVYVMRLDNTVIQDFINAKKRA